MTQQSCLHGPGEVQLQVDTSDPGHSLLIRIQDDSLEVERAQTPLLSDLRGADGS